MAIFLGWVVFSILVGILADQRGRGGVGWGFLAAVISPLLAGIILFIIPDLKKEEEEQRRRQVEQKKLKEVEENQKQEKLRAVALLTGADFLISVDKLHQLYQKNVLSEIEYHGRKMKLIDDLSHRVISESPENFLGNIIPLMEKSILSKEEMQKIKDIVFSKSS